MACTGDTTTKMNGWHGYMPCELVLWAHDLAWYAVVESKVAGAYAMLLVQLFHAVQACSMLLAQHG
jgi:hypothetical protein